MTVKARPMRVEFDDESRSTLNPAHVPDDRGCHSVSVDLSSFKGQTISLILPTEPVGTTAFDGAVWARVENQ